MSSSVSRVTVPAFVKRKTHGPPLVVLTAYDLPTTLAGEAGGVDALLVGDSLGNVLLGYETTLPVTLDEMIHHARAVGRARQRALLIVDMPWMSYHVSPQETVQNAAALMRAGAHSVKLEGGRKRLPMIEQIIDAEIPVMGHIGLTPQSIHAMGGFKVQGKQAEHARKLVQAAKSLAHAGCYAVVLEGVPARVAKMVTDAVDIPTIGIGAGMHCDGQVLVYHDLLGIEDRFVPKFVRRYADIKGQSVEAIKAYAADVRSGAFPNDDESYHMADEEAEELHLYGAG